MSIYTEDIWKSFVEKVESNFTMKTYPHFDYFFDFAKRKNELKELVASKNAQGVISHSFLPFVKMIIKTPRFRYQEGEDHKGMHLTAKEREEFYSPETKKRPISFSSHFDTYLYAFYSHALNEKYQAYIRQKGYSDSVLAYRTDLNGKCNIQFSKEAFDVVKSYLKEGPCTAIALDIKGYFDNLDHDILKEKWCKVLDIPELPRDQYKIFKTLTRYSYVNKKSLLKHFKVNLRKKKRKDEKWYTLLDLMPTEKAGNSFRDKFSYLRKHQLITENKPKEDGRYRGIPQGSSMSATLANVYLLDFDKKFSDLGKDLGFVYRRYCDDILVICKPEMAVELEGKVKSEIANYSLKIQDKKTEVIEFRKNSKGKYRAFNRRKMDAHKVLLNEQNEDRYYRSLQYLGFEFNGKNIAIRPASLSRYFRKMKGRITKTMMMAKGKKSLSEQVFKTQLFYKYTHLGRSNFLSYVYRASLKYYKNSKGEIHDAMDSKTIRRQLLAHFAILRKELKLTEEQFS